MPRTLDELSRLTAEDVLKNTSTEEKRLLRNAEMEIYKEWPHALTQPPPTNGGAANE